ncbi:MAG: L-serine ammonia-lyase, partial [Campylobacteraceae bacterium]|nr:L-serine ammonia-lyase [Campylobacteraceae bacterium]
MGKTVFDLYKIGIGPSSSHTMGPMKIAREFVKLALKKELLGKCYSIKIELFGSLGATGKGHSGDFAIVQGLMGNMPENIDLKTSRQRFKDVLKTKKINLLEIKRIDFDFQKDLIMHKNRVLKFHSNGIKLYLYDKDKKILLEKTYYSIGGGAVLDENDIKNSQVKPKNSLPYEFYSATELLEQCRKNSFKISALMMENEKSMRSAENIEASLLNIWKVMENSINSGCQTSGFLQITGVKRRANEIYGKLKQKEGFSMIDPLEVMDWIDLWALAVNEENACGGRIVTAPTNGAAGIIPSVIQYMNKFLGSSLKSFHEDRVVNFLLTAGAVGLLYQRNASISGAAVGCQGEVGVACSMAAAGLAEAMGGTIEQVENAAEIGMEHNLGLTCDPIGG